MPTKTWNSRITELNSFNVSKIQNNKINSTIGGKFGILIHLQLQTWNNEGYWIIFSSHKFIIIDLFILKKY